MAICVSSTNIDRLSIGGNEIESVYVGDNLVFRNASYTYKLENIRVSFRGGGNTLTPNQENYAVINGDYVRYKSGVENNRTTVECSLITPPSKDSYIIYDSGMLLWNRTAYGNREVSDGTVTLRGVRYGELTNEMPFSVPYGGNKIIIKDSSVDYLTINDSYDLLVPSSSGNYFIETQVTRRYFWQSDIFYRNESVKACQDLISINSRIDGIQHQGPNYEAYMTFTNNGNREVTIVAKLYSAGAWMEEDHEISMDDSDSEEITLRVGESVTTRNLTTNPRCPVGIETSNYCTLSYTINGGTQSYTVGDSFTDKKVYGADDIDISEEVSWMSISEGVLSVDKNNGAERSGVIHIKDKMLPTTGSTADMGTADYKITQMGV